MLFNSIDFLFFLPLVFIVYWFVLSKSFKAQNIFLLIASYVFYGWWDWRFLLLIVGSSVIDFFVGLSISQSLSDKRRKSLLLTSLVGNLGSLMFFKYFNFFADNLQSLLGSIGLEASPFTLEIILPVGISFYTFQTLSYTIDVYRKKLEPTKDVIAFFTYVSFFPQLVAGPIERAVNLLPQFSKKRKFEYSSAVDGMQQILWGFFKKMVIADNLAPIVNEIFNNYQEYSSLTLVMGAVLFAFQIYGDFSGYSDIAIGTARLLGFNLMQNFNFPYFSRNIAEFWRRWHISLSTWFRDYLYIPLGGSKGSNSKRIRNVFIIFLVSGFWHGANWTFVIWGGLNALYFLPLFLLGKNRTVLNIENRRTLVYQVKMLGGIVFTFLLTSLAWVFFRSDTVAQAFEYLAGIFNMQGGFSLDVKMRKELFFLLLFVAVEWVQRNKTHGLQLTTKYTPIRWMIYMVCLAVVLFFGSVEKTAFIYFAF
jgi:alginate O-acetyltransferase complex protein AlgI